jgi:hypothetical protein
MRLATLLIFSGLDQDGACIALLHQVCLATNAKAIIFHSVCVFYELLQETCFVVAVWNDISCVLRRRCSLEICVKLGKISEGTLEILQNAYGTEAMC